VQDNPAKGIALMLTAMAVLACMDAISKYLTVRYAVPQILLVRFAIFMLIALALARPTSLRSAYRSAHPKLQILRSLVITVEVGVFILAFRYLPLADTHAISGIAPLLVTALAVPMLGEKVGLRRWAAICAGFIGLVIIIRPGFTALGPAALIPLGGALLWSLYQILMRMVSADDAATSLLYMATVGLLVMAGIAPFYWVWPSPDDWFWMASLGVVGGVGHYILIQAFRLAPASLLQPFHYSVLIWATLIGFFVFGDFPDAWTILGAAVIVSSGVYALYREHLAKQS
jgi:drug/metabolite transporter (DMT)-like permease